MSDATDSRSSPTRRDFIKQCASGAAALASLDLAVPLAAAAAAAETGETAKVPWYRRAFRWGQTNINEMDPNRYDIGWWREYWKRTQVQGVIINAGGIIAYYPSKFPLQYRPPSLGDRDLYGELAKAAHDDGLFVFARMDSNRAHEALYRAHSDWFAVDANGRPHKAGDLYVSCINSPYYEDWIPGILREIIERTHPEGFTDNSWSGLGRGTICYCSHCARKFRAFASSGLPKQKDWNSPVYRQWIQWNYARRLEIWDLNNRITKEAGGPDCIWAGMNSGSITGQSASFRDLKGICERAEILMLDHQARGDSSGFQQNADTGKLVHGLLGWDKLAPESMALYQAGRPTFRVSSKPEPEARLWMIEGFAGGIQPWWHHVGAYHEDRRMYRTVEPINRWHEKNQQYLVNRQPVASVGVLWSQQNTDFYGRDNADDLVELPYRGMINALIRARIPYLPVHLDHIDREAPNLALLILPNLGAVSDRQITAIRRFVERGSGLLATGESTRFDEWGDPRRDFGLADLFGAHLPGRPDSLQKKWDGQTQHSYLRLSPELRGRVDGPQIGTEPAIAGERHPVLRGFDETDLLPYGGGLEPLKTDAGSVVPLTFVPSFPIYPPETAWMRQPKTTIPGLVLNARPGGARIAYLPADIDRRFAKDNLPDHGNLLANLIRWAAHDQIPLTVEGRGLVDCHLYRQHSRFILHLVNLTNAGTWRAPVHELIPIGPLTVRIKLPPEFPAKNVRCLVSTSAPALKAQSGWAIFEVESILDHEVMVVES